MSYTYTTVDGQRVEVHVAEAFGHLAAAFKAKFDLDLKVTSGTRTYNEQKALYAKYRAGGTLAAAPGFSNHEEDGPAGPRALDLHDTGRDSGVTVIGTVRSDWLKANSRAYSFNPAGFHFNPKEAWHYEYLGSVGGGTAPASTPASSGKVTTASFGSVLAVQEMLKRKYPLYAGRLVLDDIDGTKTQAAVKEFQRRSGLTVDGIAGPITRKALGL